MLTMKRVVGPLSLAAAGMFLTVAVGNAATTSDQPAAVLIYPKIVLNTQGPLTDTIIEIANTDTSPVDLHCFYVNATSHCSNTGLPCDSGLDCVGATPGACVPGWGETDFHVTLTQNQPFYWTASAGRNRTCASNDPPTCEPLPLIGIGVCQGGAPLCTQQADCGQGGVCLFNGQSNAGTSVPPVGEDLLFVGELKCVVVTDEGLPRSANLVYGTATIVTDFGGFVDAQSYNAVGIKARGTCSISGAFCDSTADCDTAGGVCDAPDGFVDSRVLRLGHRSGGCVQRLRRDSHPRSHLRWGAGSDHADSGGTAGWRILLHGPDPCSVHGGLRHRNREPGSGNGAVPGVQ